MKIRIHFPEDGSDEGATNPLVYYYGHQLLLNWSLKYFQVNQWNELRARQKISMIYDFIWGGDMVGLVRGIDPLANDDDEPFSSTAEWLETLLRIATAEVKGGSPLHMVL